MSDKPDYDRLHDMPETMECPDCKGAGWIEEDKCKRCQGRGEVENDQLSDWDQHLIRVKRNQY